MRIPYSEYAVVDIRKLRDYCLDPKHDDGKHKAHLFSAKLDFTAENANFLQEKLIQIAKTNDANLGRRDVFGQRYSIDFLLEWKGKRALIRSGWIIEHNSRIPKLTTCYPL